MCEPAFVRPCVRVHWCARAVAAVTASLAGWLGRLVVLRNTVMSVTVVFACTIMHEDYANKVRRKSGQKMVQVRLR